MQGRRAYGVHEGRAGVHGLFIFPLCFPTMELNEKVDGLQGEFLNTPDKATTCVSSLARHDEPFAPYKKRLPCLCSENLCENCKQDKNLVVLCELFSTFVFRLVCD